MEIGKLNRRITIQSIPPVVQNAEGEDVQGEPIDVWPNVAARFLPTTGREFGGREFEQARQMSGERNGIVEIHYRSGVTREHRILYGERVLNIVLVDDVQEQHEVLHLHWKEAT